MALLGRRFARIDRFKLIAQLSFQTGGLLFEAVNGRDRIRRFLTVDLGLYELGSLEIIDLMWGCSSVGRAVALQAIGQEFESPQLHQTGTGRFGDSDPDLSSRRSRAGRVAQLVRACA